MSLSSCPMCGSVHVGSAMDLTHEKLETYHEGNRRFYEALPANDDRGEMLDLLGQADKAAHRSLEKGEHDSRQTG